MRWLDLVIYFGAPSGLNEEWLAFNTLKGVHFYIVHAWNVIVLRTQDWPQRCSLYACAAYAWCGKGGLGMCGGLAVLRVPDQPLPPQPTPHGRRVRPMRHAAHRSSQLVTVAAS